MRHQRPLCSLLCAHLSLSPCAGTPELAHQPSNDGLTDFSLDEFEPPPELPARQAAARAAPDMQLGGQAADALAEEGPRQRQRLQAQADGYASPALAPGGGDFGTGGHTSGSRDPVCYCCNLFASSILPVVAAASTRAQAADLPFTPCLLWYVPSQVTPSITQPRTMPSQAAQSWPARLSLHGPTRSCAPQHRSRRSATRAACAASSSCTSM